jgi:hypothetical protein
VGEPLELPELAELASLRDELVSFWLEPAHRRARSFVDHQDINEVMLATSLAPGGWLPSDAG